MTPPVANAGAADFGRISTASPYVAVGQVFSAGWQTLVGQAMPAEPMAGLGVSEAARMVKLLQELRREVTIVLVEHDMNAVFALADRITVLVYGRVIASGEPAAIRSNEDVRRAYLGDQHAVTRHG